MRKVLNVYPRYPFVALGVGSAGAVTLGMLASDELIAIAFGVAVVLALGMSIYVFFDALADYRAVKAHGVNSDSELTTITFVLNEASRLAKMALLLVVLVASRFAPAPKPSRLWYIHLATTCFLEIALLMAFISYLALYTRRHLGIVQDVVESQERSGSG